MDSEVLSDSLENYLEAIYHLVKEKQAARVRDISRRLKVNMSSVSGALRLLADRKLINYAPYEVVTLTAGGKKLARDVVRRHEALRDFFVKVLSVESELADEMACKMEHAVTRRILERFIKFVEFVEKCPAGGAKWIDGIGYKCHHENIMDECERCKEMLAGQKKQKSK